MWTSALINMQDVSKCMGGSASYVLLRQRIKWGLNYSILLMVLFTLMVLMVQSGYFAQNARTHTISIVSAPTNQNQQDGPFYAPFWSVKSKRVRIDLLKQVIFKRVTISIPVVKQKQGKPWPPKVECRGKDRRKIGIRRAASSGKDKKEQKWTEEKLNEAFDMWEPNANLPPDQKLSKRQIAIQKGIPYTTLCEGLVAGRGGGKRGKIAGGKWQVRILDTGKCKRVTVKKIKQVTTSDYPLDRLRPKTLPISL